MGKGFYLSKPVGFLAIFLAVGAVATIIALSVVYSQERSKNADADVLPTDGGSTTTPTTSPSNEPWHQYRLPKSLVPIHYNVTLWPRLEINDTTGLYIFTGHSSVEFECVEATNLILIHSNKLNYTLEGFARLTSVNGQAPSISKSWLEVTTQFLVLQLDGELTVGHKYHLFTDFIGELADDLGGLYRSEYFENGVHKVVATTQMQPTDARKTFPCFDEPAMKAVFDVTLIHDGETTALSNGKLISKSEAFMNGQNVMVSVFEQTPIMSTYLLAFIVCDYGYVNRTIDGVEVRIYARKPAIDAGEGDYALNITGPILKFFEEYYNSTYPLPKSDQIALPDFNAGAMENWGLITYRETVLLYDAAFSSNSNKERIATIIGHELAHMWFGNLVTLKWWNDLWLNEGFASYVEYLGAHDAEPDWNVKDLILLGDIHRVFAVDALASSHPLSSKEEDIQRPEQISEVFDAISYSKGAAVLRMLSDFLTEDTFRAGLQTYLKAFAYTNTVYTDLWDHLQQAVPETANLPDTVHNIMNTWVLQMGFPVVTINTTTGVITQKHFLLDPDSEVTPSPYNYEWVVPIRWQKNSGAPQMYWLNAATDTNSDMASGTTTEWLLANVNVSGYYRVNYDADNWNKILNELQDNHQAIPVMNRAQLIDDAFNLARAKIIDTTLALETTKYLNNEREYMPWEAAKDNLDFFELMFDRSEVYGPMQEYMREKVRPLFEYYKNETGNWTNVPQSHMDQYNQVNAISLACRTGIQECLDLTKTMFQGWMDTGINGIHPNLRSTVYCNAIAAGGVTEWNFAWEHFKNATIATEAEKLRAALTCTKEPWLLNRYLEYTLDPDMIRKQDATSTIIYIAENVVGQSLAWDFMRDRWTHIFSQYGGGSFSFSNLISGVTERFSTQFELQELERFKQDHADVGFGSGSAALDQAIEKTSANIKWLEENQETVKIWFENEVAAAAKAL